MRTKRISRLAVCASLVMATIAIIATAGVASVAAAQTGGGENGIAGHVDGSVGRAFAFDRYDYESDRRGFGRDFE